MTGRLRGRVGGGAAACLAALALPAAASAHSELVRSTPAANARLAAPPRLVRLVFDQQISSRFAVLTLTRGQGSPVELGASVAGARLAAAVPARVRAQVPGGRPVAWKVGYRVVSGDGHPITGTVSFTVSRPAGAAGSPPEPSPRPTSGRSGPVAPAVQVGRDAAVPEEGGSAIVSTVVIGALAGGVSIGVSVWLARARSRGTHE